MGDFYTSAKYLAYLMYLPPNSPYGQSIWVTLDRIDYQYAGTFHCEPSPILGAPALHGPPHWVVSKPSSLPRNLTGTSFRVDPSGLPSSGTREPKHRTPTGTQDVRRVRSNSDKHGVSKADHLLNLDNS